MHQTITTYKELEQWVQILINPSQKSLDLLIIEGNPGVGKSSTVRTALEGRNTADTYWLQGRLSPPAFYETLYNARDCTIIVDEPEGLFHDPLMVVLLKNLCATEGEKLLSWRTTKKLPDGVPTEFSTASRLLLLTNKWATKNNHLQAVCDRGVLLQFSPSKEQIHHHALSIPDLCSTEVYTFMEKHLQFISQLSLRMYRTAEILRSGGIDWKKSLLQSYGLSPDMQAVLEVLQIDCLQEERAWLWAETTGKSQRTYYRLLKDLSQQA